MEPSLDIWEAGTSQKKFEIMLYVEVICIWSYTFTPISYLFINCLIEAKDYHYFGSFFKASVGQFERA